MSLTLADCLVGAAGTIRDAMLALNRGAVRIALAIDDDGRLVGVATDGDIRRALLEGAALDAPLGAVLTRGFVAVSPADGRSDVLDLMRARGVGAIPVVGADGRPIGLHLLHEFIEPVSRPNRALVMAGGQGLRLRPITESTPKPMLRVAGRPILERIVLHLVGHGIKRISISVNYLGQVIEDHFGDGRAFGCTIDYIREERPLGTAGAIGLLAEPPADALVVMNGDLVTQADLGALLDLHARSGFAATVGIRRYLHTVPFGCVERDGDRIVALEEKPTVERDVNTGIYAIAPALAARVPRGEPLGMPDLLDAALDRGEPVGAFEIADDWIDVGQRDQLERARGEA
jgi:dTDP-glucose pyrophosphorylase